MKWMAYAGAAVVTVLLVVQFAVALPDAAGRAREGYRRGAESACEGLSPSPHNRALGLLPAKAPGFTLKDYLGRDVSLASLRGNVVLLNFWATWCPTCVVEMPSMEKLVDRYKGKPFKLLAVSVDDDWASVRRFFAKGTNLDVVLDPPRAVPKEYGTEKFPETYLIDKEGNVRYYVVSDRDWSSPDVHSCIDAMLD